jgi:hypothetical protein
LYEKVFTWAQKVSSYALKLYQKNSVQKEDAFRAHLSSKMIPIKLAGIRTEFLNHDLISQTIAQKEKKLCLIYFINTLQALRNFFAAGDEYSFSLFEEGEALAKQVQNEKI